VLVSNAEYLTKTGCVEWCADRSLGCCAAVM